MEVQGIWPMGGNRDDKRRGRLHRERKLPLLSASRTITRRRGPCWALKLKDEQREAMLNATLLLTVEDVSVDADALRLLVKCSMAYMSDTAVLLVYCRMRESELSGVIV